MTWIEAKFLSKQIENQNNNDNSDVEDVLKNTNTDNAEDVNETMHKKWKEIIGSTPEGKKRLESTEKILEKIKAESKYLTLSNIGEIKVQLYWVDPVDIYFVVNDSKADKERRKQVIMALKEPWDEIADGWCKSIQDLQKIMCETLGIELEQNWKFWIETFEAMKRYLLWDSSREKTDSNN